jgi:hypothetical protein
MDELEERARKGFMWLGWLVVFLTTALIAGLAQAGECIRLPQGPAYDRCIQELIKRAEELVPGVNKDLDSMAKPGRGTDNPFKFEGETPRYKQGLPARSPPLPPRRRLWAPPASDNRGNISEIPTSPKKCILPAEIVDRPNKELNDALVGSGDERRRWSILGM